MLEARSSTWSPPGTGAVPPGEGERIILPLEHFKPHGSQCFNPKSVQVDMKKQIQCSQPHVRVPSMGLPPAVEHLVPRDGEGR